MLVILLPEPAPAAAKARPLPLIELPTAPAPPMVMLFIRAVEVASTRTAPRTSTATWCRYALVLLSISLYPAARPTPKLRCPPATAPTAPPMDRIDDVSSAVTVSPPAVAVLL